MVPSEKNSRGRSKVTNLDEVRLAKAKAKAQEEVAFAVDEQLEENTPTHQDLHGNRRFDAEKVARIKAAIAAGEYEINPSRIADKFIEHDRNQ